MTRDEFDLAASRWLNSMLWGSPEEVFSARVWRRRVWWWPAVIAIDVEAWRRFNEPLGHCKRAYRADKLRRQMARMQEPDDRLRASEGQRGLQCP